jgi:hypothetical protein
MRTTFYLESLKGTAHMKYVGLATAQPAVGAIGRSSCTVCKNFLDVGDENETTDFLRLLL